jgi:cobalt-zinc-cadmium efflux system outer membrane protein
MYRKLLPGVATLLLGHSLCSGITLDEALALAAVNHPQLKAGTAQIEAATAGITTAKARPNPEFGAMTGYQTYRVPGNVRGPINSFSFSQPLELGALRPTRIALAERGRQSSELALAEIRLALLSEVRRTWYQALRRREEISILTENLRLVEELRKRIQVRVEVGEAGRLELVRAETEVATARTALANSRLAYLTALSQVRASIGLPMDAELNPEGRLDPPATLGTLDQLRKETLEKHPSVALAQSEIRRAEARLTFENASKRPQPALQSQVERPPDSPTYRVGLSIPLPFWNRREGPIAEAVALVKQAQAIAQNRQLQLLAELERAYGRYQTATQQLQSYEQGILVEAEAAVKAAEAAYQLGERGIVEVLDAQRALRTVRLDFLNAQYDRQGALVDLDELRAREPGKK